eukprot:CAMPEP_0177772414 /NCGR_PEP_ID=MMETSP0491_2-20121128/12213_1 /TAXON_ID=63592 /ORGANISM="Tetraselmis chuii, Strain PLY429" /LENGTH=157 /DNA_ID=CAMNT_0019290229 /DNA_START=452 /DNA_END=926 /DNA_ORIENTATION=+
MAGTTSATPLSLPLAPKEDHLLLGNRSFHGMPGDGLRDDAQLIGTAEFLRGPAALVTLLLLLLRRPKRKRLVRATVHRQHPREQLLLQVSAVLWHRYLIDPHVLTVAIADRLRQAPQLKVVHVQRHLVCQVPLPVLRLPPVAHRHRYAAYGVRSPYT